MGTLETYPSEAPVNGVWRGGGPEPVEKEAGLLLSGQRELTSL